MKILVYGWYHQGNLGDDLFMESFQKLFPNYIFKFVDQIYETDLIDVDAIFFGGGSFLGDAIKVSSDEVYNSLKERKIFYIGIGAETDINIFHYELMKRAQLIAIRSTQGLKKILEINKNTIVIPDLVYYLQPNKSKIRKINSVLIIPNIMAIPQWNDPYWKHTSWNYFKTEFAQFLDELILKEYTINFLPFCSNYYFDDTMAAAEIMNHMVNRNNNFLLPKCQNLASATEVISQYDVVITQRYHGIILSEMSKVPYLSIYHHDKLKNNHNSSLPFYGISKSDLKNHLEQLLHTKVSNFLPIDRDMFGHLQRAVENALGADQTQQNTNSIK